MKAQHFTPKLFPQHSSNSTQSETLTRASSGLIFTLFALCMLYIGVPPVLAQTGALQLSVHIAPTGSPLKKAYVRLLETNQLAITDANGIAWIRRIAPGSYTVEVKRKGFGTQRFTTVAIDAGDTTLIAIALVSGLTDTICATAYAKTDNISRFAISETNESSADYAPIEKRRANESGGSVVANRGSVTERQQILRLTPGVISDDATMVRRYMPNPASNEEYHKLNDNEYLAARTNPLSTFSIDVDVASYANIRRFLTANSAPPIDAVRIEEMVNYFKYDYPQPTGKDPCTITTEVAACPWNSAHSIIGIGVQAREIAKQDLPPSNLVFLIDVSGSMMPDNKLPLLKRAFRLLVNELRAQDHVAIVVYAGNAGLVLPSTSGTQKEKIISTLEHLEAGGSTAGGEGILLAYKIAKENFNANGNNRVILATDGDFNVGLTGEGDLVRMMEEKRKEGVFLSILGVGEENLKDSRMEQIADQGNGNYAYLDNILEAEKVLVTQMGGTLYTIAKDVKIQVEFNPTKVKGYRLIGYEDRMLAKEDFNNDQKDAGELGSGHTVTALYELIPASSKEEVPQSSVDSLKYQKPEALPTVSTSNELLTVKLRYKDPKDTVSKLMEHVVASGDVQNISAASDNLRFSCAVASFGMLLRNSEFKGDATLSSIKTLADGARGRDAEGYRAEFFQMLKRYELIQSEAAAK
jgi:Ca-activated chloride channel family protein